MNVLALIESNGKSFYANVDVDKSTLHFMKTSEVFRQVVGELYGKFTGNNDVISQFTKVYISYNDVVYCIVDKSTRHRGVTDMTQGEWAIWILKSTEFKTRDPHH